MIRLLVQLQILHYMIIQVGLQILLLQVQIDIKLHWLYQLNHITLYQQQQALQLLIMLSW